MYAAPQEKMAININKKVPVYVCIMRLGTGTVGKNLVPNQPGPPGSPTPFRNTALWSGLMEVHLVSLHKAGY